MKDGHRPRVLFVLTLPPPYNGQVIDNQRIVDSNVIRKKFKVKILELPWSRSNSVWSRLRKILSGVYCIYLLVVRIILFRPNIIYFCPTSTGLSFIRDVIYSSVMKFFGRSHIIHRLHTRGFSDNGWLKTKLTCYLFSGTKNLAISERVASDISEFVAPESTENVMHGIPDPYNHSDKKFCESKVWYDERNSTKIRFLFLSNLHPQKGIPELLKASSKLKERNENFEVKIVGAPTPNCSEGDLYSLIKSYKVEDNVHYLGPKYNEDKDNIFNSSDVFIFPTYHPGETFGLVLLEAMSHGLPTIATKHATIPDIVEHGGTGFLVRRQNAEDITEKMNQFLNQKRLIKTLGLKARKRYLDNFRFKREEKQITNYLENTLKNEN